MTLETRMASGWQYRAEGFAPLVQRFMAEQVPYDEDVVARHRGTSRTPDLVRDDAREYKFADFVADAQAEIRRATATDAGVYGDYDEMVEEREHVLVMLLASCDGTDLQEIEEALDELYSWADNYDVWLGR